MSEYLDIHGVYFDMVNHQYIVEPYAYDDFMYQAWFHRCVNEWKVHGSYQRHLFQVRGYDGVFKVRDIKAKFDEIIAYSPFKPVSLNGRFIINDAQLDKWCEGLDDVLPLLYNLKKELK